MCFVIQNEFLGLNSNVYPHEFMSELYLNKVIQQVHCHQFGGIWDFGVAHTSAMVAFDVFCKICILPIVEFSFFFQPVSLLSSVFLLKELGISCWIFKCHFHHLEFMFGPWKASEVDFRFDGLTVNIRWDWGTFFYYLFHFLVAWQQGNRILAIGLSFLWFSVTKTKRFEAEL